MSIAREQLTTLAYHILGDLYKPPPTLADFGLRAEIHARLDQVMEMPLDAADKLTSELIDKHLTLSYADGDPTVMTPAHLGALKSIQARTARKVAQV